jgi:hypothetical protein
MSRSTAYGLLDAAIAARLKLCFAYRILDAFQVFAFN